MWFKKKKPQTVDQFLADYNKGKTIPDLQEKANVIGLSQAIRKNDLEIKDKEDFLKLRLFWGKALVWILASMLIYNAVLVILIGTNALSFQSPTVTSVVVGQNFVEVIGLVTIVLKALFPSGGVKN